MNTVSKSYDIVVIGAGPGGLPAAIVAARRGAKVLLVEKNGYLGGNLAIGLPLLGYLDKNGIQVTAGFAQELVDTLMDRNACYGHSRCPMHNSVTLYNHEEFKLVAFEKCLEAGVEILLNTEVIDADVENGSIRKLTLFGKGYRIEVEAKVFIDATGDGDVGYLAGAHYEKGQKGTGVMQPPTLMFTLGNVNLEKFHEFISKDPEQMILGDTMEVPRDYNPDHIKSTPNHVFVGLRKLFSQLKAKGELPVDRDTFIYINSLIPGEVNVNSTRHLNVDGSNVFDITRAEIEGHFQIPKLTETLRKYVPGFENCYITRIFPTLGVRETRRFAGIKQLTEDKIVVGDIPEDTVALGSYIIDIHDGGGAGTIIKRLEKAYGIPYGCLVSKDIDNLMFSGRCISMDAVVLSSARVMPTCMAIGEAAGVGAAVAVNKGVKPAEVDASDVVKILKENGAILNY
ncbi:MAG TPA: FAD-dependent oxidoreductase [Thermoclostridium sp.]